MAGHSKWANIKHRKGAQDAKRSKEFAKLAKSITVAAQAGSPDPETNALLRLAVLKAKAKSMPKKNIDAAIAKATGDKSEKNNYQELSYAANVDGVSFLINCLTDNPKRLLAEIQYLISRAHGSLVKTSAIDHIFERKGILAIETNGLQEDVVMTQVLESGAEDFEVSDELFLIYTQPQSFSKVRDSLVSKGFENFKLAEVKYLPIQEVEVQKDKIEKITKLIDLLEENDDVQDVYHNLNLTFTT